MAKCDCADWEENTIILPNIPIIDGTIATKRQKDGTVKIKRFTYCQYCGKKLKGK